MAIYKNYHGDRYLTRRTADMSKQQATETKAHDRHPLSQLEIQAHLSIDLLLKGSRQRYSRAGGEPK
jgi:hypothetical protein